MLLRIPCWALTLTQTSCLSGSGVVCAAAIVCLFNCGQIVTTAASSDNGWRRLGWSDHHQKESTEGRTTENSAGDVTSLSEELESTTRLDCTRLLTFKSITTHWPTYLSDLLQLRASSLLQRPLSASRCWDQNCFWSWRVVLCRSDNLELTTRWSHW